MPPRSSAPSAISRRARDTVAEVPSQAGVPGEVSGRQRRHGRKPASAAAAAQAWGAVDVVCNNAGIQPTDSYRPAHELTEAQWDRIVDVNLKSVFLMTRACVPGMIARAGGVIINTASVAAYEGQIGQAAYSASKGGVVGMTLPIARELARHGVRVMAIAPGIFWTPMVDGMPEHIQEALGASIPFPSRLGKPEEFAELAAHIVENGYFNGETIRLDGAVRLQPK